ncbi:MAG: PAS domain-containing sensor histidine kinase [Candidatus Lokiarchaeota archaeon]|nr:PAS domain-containing sensor histidine kinase [Candidatus Lokiarchaeota archaeon]
MINNSPNNLSLKDYQTIIKSLGDLVTIIDSNLKIEYINEDSHLKLLNRSKEELLGVSIEKIIYYKDFNDFLDNFKKAIKDGERTIDVRFLRKDKHKLWFESKLKYLNEFEFNSKILVVSREITERKNVEKFISEMSERRKTEEIIKKEIEKVKEFTKIRKALISSISHELKTPLMSINGASELLLQIYCEELGKDAKELIQMVARGGERLEYLIGNLMDVSRMDYDKLKLEKSQEDLCDILNSCSREMQYQLNQREIQLHIELPNAFAIELDRIRIEQVITNLLLNAIKNTPPKGEIFVNINAGKDYVWIYIKDTGIGLTQEEIQQLFTEFGKIERSGEGFEYLDIQGSGLGLFITKQIVEMHDGEISAMSEGRHKGSTFIVKLPRKA